MRNKMQSEGIATFTSSERDYIRRQLDRFFSTLPTVADGFQLKTWRGGPAAGKAKPSANCQGAGGAWPHAARYRRTPQGGTPVLLRDVARIELGPEERRGIAELNGQGEVVSGIALQRDGQNALRVIDSVK